MCAPMCVLIYGPVCEYTPVCVFVYVHFWCAHVFACLCFVYPYVCLFAHLCARHFYVSVVSHVFPHVSYVFPCIYICPVYMNMHRLCVFVWGVCPCAYACAFVRMYILLVHSVGE